MRYVTYAQHGLEYPGLLHEQTLYDLNEALGQTGQTAVPSLRALIEAAAENPKILTALQAVDFGKCAPVENATLCAPIPRPARNIFCLGKNYAAHATEVKETRLSATGIPQTPIYFTKTASPALPAEGVIDCPLELTQKLDYEAELAVVIGKAGKNIPAADAESYIFGYTILNDISARDLQAKHEQWFRGKNLDTFCPMGPVLVDKSELSFPVNVQVTCRVNGEVRQNANTSTLIFDIPAILSDLSHGYTLLPGDIISTGTPAGVGAGFDPPRFLQDGDVVECEIERIGILRNIVRRTV